MDLKKNDGAGDGKLSRLIDTLQDSFHKVSRKRNYGTVFLHLGILLTGVSILTILESFFFLHGWQKILYLCLLVIVITGIILRSFNKRNDINFNEFYQSFTDAYSLPSLKHALDLGLSGRNQQLKLYQAALTKNLETIDESDIRNKLHIHLKNGEVQQSMMVGAVVLCISLVLLGAIFWEYPAGLSRTLHAWKSYQPPNPYTYSVVPGDVVLEQSTKLDPRITFSGSFPKQLSLAFKTEAENKYRIRPVSKIKNDTAVFIPITINTNGRYYFIMDGFKSPSYKINVQIRPRFQSLSAHVVPPSYTQLDTTTYEYPFSQIQAYKGSKLELSGSINKMVAALYAIHSLNKDTSAITVGDQNHVHLTVPFIQRDTLTFMMQDRAGLQNNNPFTVVLEPTDDEAPFVQIVEPGSDTEMESPRELSLRYKASDDFGLRSSRLHYQVHRAFVDKPETGSVNLSIPLPEETLNFGWDLTQLKPKPRDVIHYWIEVKDNNAVDGPSSARSQTLTITFPSLTEYLDEVDKREGDVSDQLEEISRSHEQMKEEYEHFKEQLEEHPDGNWEQKQSLEDVRRQHKKVEKQIDELNSKFEDIKNELSKNNVLSEETRDSYRELQKLMKEIDDPELRKALEELQKAMGNIDQQQMRNALEHFEFNEKQYQERIKRTIELFKNLKLNSDLEKMASALEELSKQEKELSQSDKVGNQLKKQQAVQGDLKKIDNQLDNLSETSPRQSEKKVRELQEESRRQLNNVDKELDENIRQLQQDSSGQQPSNNQNIRQQQQNIRQQFEKMAEHMRSAKTKFNHQRKQVNISALQYILYSLINLSEKQEDLTQETEHLDNRSPAFVKKARTQQTIANQFDQLADSLFKISSEVPQLSNTVNKKKNIVKQHLASSVDELAERNRSQSTFSERQSLGGINELSSMIASLLDQLKNEQQMGGGGDMSMQQLMEKLREMSGQQQNLNQQIQNLINDIQGDRLTNDQINRLNQMARQQNQIRKQLREIQQKGGLEPGDKILSELERMSEDMEDTINDIRGGQMDRILVKRQQNILSRMLDSEKALQKRGEDKKREATAAEETPRRTPPDITLEELQKKIHSYLNNPEHTKFSEDYQKLIEQYFELLRKQGKGTID